MDKIGISVVAFNRPLLLTGVLNQLQENFDNEMYDIHLFIDSPYALDPYYKTTAEHTKMLVDFQKRVFMSIFPNGEVHPTDKNLGSGFNQKRAMDYIFSNYDIGIFFEDDFIPDSNYIENILKMSKQFENDSRVGWITYNGEVRFGDSPKVDINYQNYLKTFPREHSHRWGWLGWANKYLKYQPLMEEYYNILKTESGVIDETDYPSYTNRNHNIIRDFYEKNGFNRIHTTGQDGAHILCMLKYGMYGVSVNFNSGRGVGEFSGIHNNIKNFLDPICNTQIWAHRQNDFSSNGIAIEWDDDYSSVFLDLTNLKYCNHESDAWFYHRPYIWRDYWWYEIVSLKKIIDEKNPVKVLQIGADYSSVYFPEKNKNIKVWDNLEFFYPEYNDKLKLYYDKSSINLEYDKFNEWFVEMSDYYDLVYIRRMRDHNYCKERKDLFDFIKDNFHGDIILKKMRCEDFGYEVVDGLA